MRTLAGKVRYFVAVVGILSFLMCGAAWSQSLEPRAYSPSPVGTTFAGVSFGRSSGDVSFDPTVPIINAHATLYSTGLGVGQTFGLMRRQAMFTAALPYVWGNGYGDVGNGQSSLYRSGLADIRTRISLNLRGVPAMSVAEFAKQQHRNFIVATSLTVAWPTGQYGSTKLVNLGTNRWSFKPEFGISYPIRKVDLDLYAAAEFFTANSSYYTGQSVKTQDPLTSLQGHVSYTVRRGLWVAIDGTWYGGGAASVNGGTPTERQANSRLGATASLPLARGQSLKIAYSSGVSGNVGSQFSTVGLGWQYVWFDKRRR
jgi:Putative MetA-pathway of phenol degradation